MIGQTIRSPWSPPVGVFLWMLVAASLDVLAAVDANVHYAVLSLWPWLAAGFLWLVRTRPFVARFSETALEVEQPPLSIPYANLQGLLAPRRPANLFKAGPRSYLIQVIHTGGVLSIPARIDVPSDEVFSFLYRRFTPSGSRDVPTALEGFLRRKERTFGPERVWTYRARSHLGRNKKYRGLTASFLALTLASVGWFAWGIVQKEPGWIAGGVAGVFFGAMLTLVYWLAGRQSLASVRKWRQAGLVIAPDGLALVQGDLIGELSWDEVREVKLGKADSTFWVTALGSPWLSYQVSTAGQHNKGLVLKVEGAVIVIADIYDRPLSLLYQHIRYHWRGETGEEGWKPESMPPASGAGVVPADSDDVPPLSSEGIAGHG